MALDIDFRQDVLDIFFQDGPRIEDIVYTPTGEAPRNVKAVVYRKGSLTSSPFSRTGKDNDSKERLLHAEVDLPIDDVIGVTKITIREDKIEYKKHIGSTTTITKTIGGILLQNTGYIKVILK